MSKYLLQVTSGKCLLSVFWPSDLFNSIFGAFLVTIEFFVPLIILIYCYGRIVWTLKRRTNVNIGGNDILTDKFEVAKTNTIKTFLIVSICFTICWAGNQVYYLMFNLGFPVSLNSAVYKVTLFMVFLNCTVNPFIYLAKYNDFQMALKKFVAVTKTLRH